MAKKNLSDRSWIVLLILAIGLLVACSSSSSGPVDSGSPDSMTKA